MNIIFFVVFSMYQYNLESVMYATIISWTIISVYIIYDYSRFYTKTELLENISKRLSVLSSEFPSPSNIYEMLYQELVINLQDAYRHEISDKDLEYTNRLEYYTLWVHQIKTPIAAMRLLLQQGEVNEYNQNISDELFKIEQYVEMVLQYVRANRIANDLSINQYELDILIKKAVHKYGKMFIRKKIGLEYKPVNMVVTTDERWLVFVLEQIISNALKYTTEGTVKIYVENEKVLVIEDSGIGIKAEDLPRIFESGFTGYNGRLNQKSTGIGLYLSKIILNKLSHEINIESTVSKGTKVMINLRTYLLGKD